MSPGKKLLETKKKGGKGGGKEWFTDGKLIEFVFVKISVGEKKNFHNGTCRLCMMIKQFSTKRSSGGRE